METESMTAAAKKRFIALPAVIFTIVSLGFIALSREFCRKALAKEILGEFQIENT